MRSWRRWRASVSEGSTQRKRRQNRQRGRRERIETHQRPSETEKDQADGVDLLVNLHRLLPKGLFLVVRQFGLLAVGDGRIVDTSTGDVHVDEVLAHGLALEPVHACDGGNPDDGHDDGELSKGRKESQEKGKGDEDVKAKTNHSGYPPPVVIRGEGGNDLSSEPYGDVSHEYGGQHESRSGGKKWTYKVGRGEKTHGETAVLEGRQVGHEDRVEEVEAGRADSGEDVSDDI